MVRIILEEHKLDPNGDIILVLDQSSDGNAGKTHNVQVSSKHLMLASPVFQTMLAGSFKEGTILRSAGSLILPLPEDDSKALTILLNIIHGRIKQLPATLTADRLTKVVILIHKYQFQNVTGILTDTWFERVASTSWKQEDDFDIEEFSWRKIFVTWVLKRSEEFKDATREAIRELRAKDEFDQSEYAEPAKLHLPQSITDDIFDRRQKALTYALALIERLHTNYTHSVFKCGPGCDTLLLGALSRIQMEIARIEESPAPLSEWSYNSIVHMVLDKQWSINFRTHCRDCEMNSPVKRVGGGNARSRKLCGNRSTVEGFVAALDEGPDPLELEAVSTSLV